jgi:hypothetical protein
MTTDSTIQVPDPGDWLPAYVKNAWAAEEWDRILEWIMYGEPDAEQAPEDDPEDRYRDFQIWRGRRKPKWYVNTYFTHEEYGGPEEGGWYYTVHAPAEGQQVFQPIGPFDDYVKACEISNLMRDVLRANHPDERSYIIVERHKARLYPRVKPHYC